LQKHGGKESTSQQILEFGHPSFKN